MKNKLLFAAIVGVGMAACAPDDEVDTSMLPESEGVQEPASATERRGCATEDLPAAEIARIEAELDAQYKNGELDVTASHEIPVYWHRLHSTNGAGGAVAQRYDQLDLVHVRGMNTFSVGQEARMLAMWNTYR